MVVSEALSPGAQIPSSLQMIFLYLLGEEKAGLLSRFTGLHAVITARLLRLNGELAVSLRIG